MAKTILPLFVFVALGILLNHQGLLNDFHFLLPYSVLGLFCVVGSYVAGQCYRMPLKPEGKAVFIAGCDAGYGYHTARSLAALGFTVFAGCQKPSSDHVIDLASQSNGRIRAFNLDVTSQRSVDEAADFVRTNLASDHFWAYIYIAGVQQHQTIENLAAEVYEEHLDVNCLGLVRLTRAFLPLIRSSRSRVINVLGYQARVSQPGDVPFSMSQHASLSYTDCLRQELQPFGIKVITVETGQYSVNRCPTTVPAPVPAPVPALIPASLPNSAEKNGEKPAKYVSETAGNGARESVCGGEEAAAINGAAVISVDVIVRAVRSRRPRKRYLSSVGLRLEMTLLTCAPSKLSDWYMGRYRRVVQSPSTSHGHSPGQTKCDT